MSEILNAAHSWLTAGCSVIPIRPDGTKRPIFDWKRFQSEQMSHKGVDLHFSDPCGIAVICGAVSGNLEMLELEGRAATADILGALDLRMEEEQVGHIWRQFQTSGYCEITPSGGMHLLYRVRDHDVPGNTKVARRPATPEELAQNPQDKIKVLAETRGEGGYVIVAPSPGICHPSGQGWDVVSGQIGQIPVISWDERNRFHAAVATLDQMPQPQVPQAPLSFPFPSATNRPGDDFNNKASWEDILIPAGWQLHHVGHDGAYWTRPGKDPREGFSATTGRNGEDRLYVFSSSTGFETENPYSKFAAYALLNFANDYAAATRDLAAQGFGEQRAPKAPVTQLTSLTFHPVAAGVYGTFDPPAVPPRPDTQPQYRHTSVGNAERMERGWTDDFRFIPATGQWMAWNGTKWREDIGQALVTKAVTAMTYDMFDEADRCGDEAVAKALRSWATKSQMDAGMKGTINQFSHREAVVGSPEEFDQALGFLTLPNGVLDLKNQQLLPHDRKYMSTQMFGASYDPDAKAPMFEQFMATVLPDEQMRRFVQRSIGYTLMGKPDQRAFFIVHGPPRTGKSQFINLISMLFGDYADTAMAGTFHKVDRKGDAASPGLHALRNKRFVTGSEESENTVLDNEALKRLAGNEAVNTRALYQSGQRWKPQMVIWIATNPLPQLNTDDSAIWDRVKPVPFTTLFSAKGGDGTVKETPGICEDIFAAEASGILNWALEGLAMFWEEGGLNEPEQVSGNVEAYRHEIDHAAQFVDEARDLSRLEEEPESRINVKHLYKAYFEWSTEGNIRAMTDRKFYRRIKSIFNITEFTKSHGGYFLEGWKWNINQGIFGTMSPYQ